MHGVVLCLEPLLPRMKHPSVWTFEMSADCFPQCMLCKVPTEAVYNHRSSTIHGIGNLSRDLNTLFLLNVSISRLFELTRAYTSS